MLTKRTTFKLVLAIQILKKQKFYPFSSN